MGVIPCSKKNCENIMCKYQSREYNLCESCFSELVKSGPVDIDFFMDRPPVPEVNVEWLIKLKNIFTDRDPEEKW